MSHIYIHHHVYTHHHIYTYLWKNCIAYSLLSMVLALLGLLLLLVLFIDVDVCELISFSNCSKKKEISLASI